MECEECGSSNTETSSEDGDTYIHCKDCGYTVENGVVTKKSSITNTDICDICKEKIELKQYIRVGGYKIHPECGELTIAEYLDKYGKMVECENCKAEIPSRHRFCRYCGHEQEKYGEQN